MKQVVSVRTMRQADAAAIAGGVPARELMKSAGEAVFHACPWQGRVAVVCGTGNNGGDGYVLAGLLCRNGISCRLLLLEDAFSPDGRFYFEECLKLGVPWSLCADGVDFSEDAEIVDCLFGTGFRGNVQGLAADVIEKINFSGKKVISVDINSGMNGDSGCGSPCVHSDLTVSVGTLKTGHFLGQAKDVIGKLQNADIGIRIPESEPCCFLVEQSDFGAVLRSRSQISHKGNYGYVGILGGCTEYAGAVKLANLGCAALRSGCGVATLIIPASIASFVAPHLLESTLELIPDENGHMMFLPDVLDRVMNRRCALAVGMGWGTAPANREILIYLLSHFSGRLLIDADGLNTLAKLPPECLQSTAAQVLLTPHYKEFERISGFSMQEIQAAPVSLAQDYAARNHVCLLLKGACTVITDGKTTFLVDRGCAGMATAGSGDVLSGILVGLLGYSPVTPLTAACGAYLAGLAGELAAEEEGEISMIASDTVCKLPQSVQMLVRASAHSG